jgi:hypothetical protein
MGADWIEKSEKRDGPPSTWLVGSERPSLVLTSRRRSAGQSSKSWRTWSRRNLTACGNHASCLGGLETFPGVHYMTVSAQSRHIQESAPQPRAKHLPLRDSAPSLLLETKHSRLEGHVQSASIPKGITVSLWDNIV